MTIDLAWVQSQFSDVMGLAPIGQGGQRLVLAGRHAAEGEVVVKLFYPNAEIDRVLREIEAVRRIASPRVPRILASGTVPSPLGNLVWVREELVVGTDLRLILRNGPLAVRTVIRIGAHLLEALAAAESARIVHRDVKPDNVKIGPSENAWLLDFGFARHLDLASLTASASAFGPGTPGYAPPEQARNRKFEIDSRADLFALGVTLYECIEGVNPFRAGARDDLEILRRTETQPLPAITRPVDSAGQLRDLVLAMTRHRRDSRPATVTEALMWMQEICESEGIR